MLTEGQVRLFLNSAYSVQNLRISYADMCQNMITIEIQGLQFLVQSILCVSDRQREKEDVHQQLATLVLRLIRRRCLTAPRTALTVVFQALRKTQRVEVGIPSAALLLVDGTSDCTEVNRTVCRYWFRVRKENVWSSIMTYDKRVLHVKSTCFGIKKYYAPIYS